MTPRPWDRASSHTARAVISVAVALLLMAPAASGALPDFDRPDNWFDSHVYHHHTDLTTELQELEADHPALVNLDAIGTSVMGRELWTVRVTDPAYPSEGKTRIYVDGEHHGNEYLGGELAILLIRHLVEDRTDPAVEQVLRESIVWVTPMLNPDGNARDQRNNVNGVDLNRHYPFVFSPGGSHGDAPATEPEVAANVAFMEGADLDLYMTLHTGVVTLIYPWGYTEEPCPDVGMFERFRDLADAHGVRYGQASIDLYITTGSSKDFAYGALGVPGFTFEVDDQQTRQISRREDIAQRLSDELDVMMELLLAASLMKARLEPRVTSVEVEGGNAEVTVELANPTYTPANNTTVTVEAYRDGALEATASRTLDVPPEASATARVSIDLGEAGDWQLRTLVTNPTLLLDNATSDSQVVDLRTVNVQGGLMGGEGGALWALVLVLALAGVAMAYWAWAHGWRPGWAARGLRTRLSRHQGT